MPGLSHTANLLIREFAAGDASAFRTLNEEWIIRYFALEPKDLHSLTDPQTTIIDHGGHIFLASFGESIIGCCALLFMARGEYEVAKMAVTKPAQGTGVGRALLVHTIAAATALRATRLYLETNQILSSAIHLYESCGFSHLPMHRIVPSAYTRANVYMELLL